MENNEELKEANEKLQSIIEDERMQLLAEFRQSAIWDENTARSSGYAKGKEHGLTQGMKQGIKQGLKIAKLEDAKKMLKKGFKLDTIIEITGLSKEEILN